MSVPAARGLRQTLPYLNGVYVGVGAVSDLRLVVDGPYCVVQKAELHMAHDPASGLMAPAGVGRVGHTDLRFNTNVVYNVTVDRGHDIVAVLQAVAAQPEVGLVLLTSMDFHQILAAPLERYRRSAQEAGGAPIALLDARSLASDWLDGYAAVLERVAALAPLPEPAPEAGVVALVGHLFDRRAGDVSGNRAGRERLTRLLGLEPALVWPDGGTSAALAAAARAEHVVSLPYARQAGRHLAERLGRPLLEAPLPLGIGGTRAFLAALADGTGRQAALEPAWEQELAALIPQIRDHAFRYLAGRRIWLEVDPQVAPGLLELVEDLGMEPAGLIVTGDPGPLPAAARAMLDAAGARFEPPLEERPADGLVVDQAREVDVVVASTLFPQRPRRATWLPFGYPNYLHHPLRPAPYLGSEGVRAWVERLSEACQAAEARSAGTPLGGASARASGSDEEGA